MQRNKKKYSLYGYVKKIYYLFLNTYGNLRNIFFKFNGDSGNILFYHRVADVKVDPHLLCVSISNFERQMEYLKNHYNVIKMSTLLEKLSKKEMKSSDVVVTFDDGYADNLYNALPILEKYSIPVTIYVTVDKIDSIDPFYWDLDTPVKDLGRALKQKELIRLASHPLVEIGSHTLTHPILSSLDLNKQNEEIHLSRLKLEKLLGRTVLSFSYPIGSSKCFSSDTIKIVEDSGYTSACTTQGDRVTYWHSKYALPRKLVRDWDVKKFSKVLEDFFL